MIQQWKLCGLSAGSTHSRCSALETPVRYAYVYTTTILYFTMLHSILLCSVLYSLLSALNSHPPKRQEAKISCNRNHKRNMRERQGGLKDNAGQTQRNILRTIAISNPNCGTAHTPHGAASQRVISTYPHASNT